MRTSLEYLFGWGYRDIEKLEELLEAAEKFNIYPDEILENIKEIENDPTDINSWIYSTMSLLFYKIMDEVEKEIYDKNIIKKVEKIREEFSPYVNAMDSWFNNFLDEINLQNTKDVIIEEVINALKEM
jgi:predicted ribosome quality control (RQC) complex YloA/Tae2 family protein